MLVAGVGIVLAPTVILIALRCPAGLCCASRQSQVPAVPAHDSVAFLALACVSLVQADMHTLCKFGQLQCKSKTLHDGPSHWYFVLSLAGAD